ncbi:MAG: A/G-specific adenine glycosylase [Candidatus Moranbacteria bacterium]|nr:A/G-specific adenine glycosylase [Candidatus Moranbacteria bacterium]
MNADEAERRNLYDAEQIPRREDLLGMTEEVIQSMRKDRLEKLGFFEEKLDDFFRRAGREHLPWRKRGISAYEVWVSEIMLQQTQVSRVVGYYERFLERFPTVVSLAAATWEEFLPYYAGLGYYARGRNMLKTARVVVSEHSGEFPKVVEALKGLPGVGPYTAAAIASFAYGRNTVAWDTNLRRVVGRFFFGSKKADIPFSEFEAAFLLPAKELNAALMDFGSAICVARPKCGACPMKAKCRYYRERGSQESGIRNRESSLRMERRSEQRRWKDAQVMLILHADHKAYYSSKKSGYAPFLIPSSHNTRAGIKDWFRRKYGLELAVRPPHGRVVSEGKPTLLVNAQILLGKPDFPEFGRESYERRLRRFFGRSMSA